MTLEIFFKIAFFVILFSFAYVITAYTQKAKSRKESASTRVQLHHEHEVPLLLRIRQIFGIAFYLGILVWTFSPKFMEWSALNLPAWARWTGLSFGLFSIFLNGWSHKTLGERLGEELRPCAASTQSP